MMRDATAEQSTVDVAGVDYLRAAGLGACEIDGDRRLSACELCWRILGWECDAPDVTTLGRLIDSIHPDDRQKIENAIEGALDRRGRLEVVFRIPLADKPARVVGLRGSC